jgi:hypothetical protein
VPLLNRTTAPLAKEAEADSTWVRILCCDAWAVLTCRGLPAHRYGFSPNKNIESADANWQAVRWWLSAKTVHLRKSMQKAQNVATLILKVAVRIVMPHACVASRRRSASTPSAFPANAFAFRQRGV